MRGALRRTSEAVRVLEKLGRQPYHDLPDLTEVLPAARVHGQHLDTGALMDAASFADGATEIARRVAGFEGAPTLAHRASAVRDLSAVSAAVRRAILPSGEVADDASPRLSDVRRTLLRLRGQLTSVMEGYLRNHDTERLLQDKIVTTRNDRYVLLIKAEHRGQLPGIIHGTSSSGASLFVEPMPAVELNNDIVALQDEERREVVRILTELTGHVGDRADDIAFAMEVLGELDALQAMALAARDMAATAPIVEEGGAGLDLVDARHPLLMSSLAERLGLPRRSSSEPVPVSLRVGFGAPILVVSGPNTGGKTVALKTVGLLALMAQSGLHIPAAPGSRLPVFSRIFADIGDDQSIAENLSTFSAHLAAIGEMTKDLAQPALVLLDEVGAGTDPTEGGALGVAIVDHFRARGAMVVATTHHGLMKAYALSTPGVACGSFGYDPETYEPTYRLTLGTAGRSLALEMAERLGLPASVVEDARSRRNEKEAQAEALLQKLEEDRRELEREEDRLKEVRSALEAERQRLLAAEGEIEGKRRALVAEFKKDLQRRSDELVRRAAGAIEDAVRKAQAARKGAAAAAGAARGDVLRFVRETQAELVEGLPEAAAPEIPEAGVPVAVGTRVRVRSLGVTGEVRNLTPQGDAELAVGGKRLVVPVGDLVALGAPVRPTTQPSVGNRVVRSSGVNPSSLIVDGPLRGRVARSSGVNPSSLIVDDPLRGSVKPSGAVPGEINLVGLRVEEALPRVDKLLDDAALSDRREIRVIHGFGSGRLRKAVADLLEGHPHVATFRAGGAGEGGGGVTIVELKE